MINMLDMRTNLLDRSRNGAERMRCLMLGSEHVGPVNGRNSYLGVQWPILIITPAFIIKVDSLPREIIENGPEKMYLSIYTRQIIHTKATFKESWWKISFMLTASYSDN